MSLLKNRYTRTSWVDGKTMINAERLNNIERGVSTLFSASLAAPDIMEGKGMKVETTDDGKVKISTKMTVEVIFEEQSEYDPDIIYFLVSGNGIIKKIIIKGIATPYGMGL